MLSRRNLLLASVAACACSRSPAPSRSPSWPRTSVHAGITFVELFPHGADESSPLVVAIHGRGDRPDNWVQTWSAFPERVRVALPRALHPLDDGWSWFEFREGMTDEQFGAEVGAAEARLWPAIAELAAGGRPIVTGFSQGGILSFALASRHGDAIAAAFPVAGSCPGPLLPRAGTRAAPLVAFHGTGDDVLAFRWGKGAVDAFRESGNSAELRTYPGVGHAMTPAMRADLWGEIQKALPRARAPG